MQIADYVRGQVSRAFLLKKLFPLIYIIYIIGILIANLCYPGVYDWRYMVMSELGSAQANPSGFYFLVIGGFFLGIGLIPLIGYVYKHLNVIDRGTAFVGALWFLIGALCLIVLGVTTFIPDLPQRTHENLAILGLLGLLLALFFWGFPLIKDSLPRFHGHRQFNVKLMILGFGLMWFIVLGALAGVLYVEISEVEWGWVSLEWLEYNPPPPIWASLALWEWMVIFGLMIYLVILIIIIPEEVQALKKDIDMAI